VPENQKLKWSVSQPGVESLNYSVVILRTLHELQLVKAQGAVSKIRIISVRRYGVTAIHIAHISSFRRFCSVGYFFFSIARSLGLVGPLKDGGLSLLIVLNNLYLSHCMMGAK